MKSNQKSLASRLLYLPLDTTEKVFLWLTYKNLKPVSEVTAVKRNKALLHRLMCDKEFRKSYKNPYNFNSRNSKRIRKWIRDAGMVVLTKGIEWHVGREKEKVIESLKTIRKFDYQNEIKSGSLFGFPEASVKAYAHNRIAKKEDQISMIMIGKERFSNDFLKDKYYAPYVLYGIPENLVAKESQIAKKWADTIRQDVPLLAKWFEKEEFARH